MEFHSHPDLPPNDSLRQEHEDTHDVSSCCELVSRRRRGYRFELAREIRLDLLGQVLGCCERVDRVLLTKYTLEGGQPFDSLRNHIDVPVSPSCCVFVHE